MGKRKINKSEKIREAMKANPKAGPTEIVKILAESTPKIVVSASMVSNAKAAAEKKAGTKAKPGKRGRPVGSTNKPKPVAAAAGGDMVALKAAVKLLRAVGESQQRAAAMIQQAQELFAD